MIRQRIMRLIKIKNIRAIRTPPRAPQFPVLALLNPPNPALHGLPLTASRFVVICGRERSPFIGGNTGQG